MRKLWMMICVVTTAFSAGCGSSSGTANPAASPIQPARTTLTPQPAETPATETAGSNPETTSATGQASKAPARPVANFVGKGLQTSQDDAQSLGFRNLTSHDASGRQRHQILDRDWVVCSQTPSAGTSAPTDTLLDFAVVKTVEVCPTMDGASNQPSSGSVAEGMTLPDFKGKSLNVAHDSLPSGASVTTTDVSGSGRAILLESNWKVCSQKPAPGTTYAGQPITLSAVKFGESCP